MLNAMFFIIAGFAIGWIFRMINEPEGDNAGTHFSYKHQLKNKSKH